MILPFALMLLAIALMPFIHLHWWERHFPKVAVGLGAITTIYYVFFLGNPGRMLHVAHEYVSFMALIGSLFVVAGGIHIQVKGEASPWKNCLFLFIGAMLSNVIGTTGASMLLIRPWIRTNRHRVTPFHIVFFIFVVSNVGGCLTPIGDPPLFLGYIKGVPFWWVLEKCWVAWAIVVASLIGVFYVFDRRSFLQAPSLVKELDISPEAWKIEGLRNIGFLAAILAAVFLKHPTGLSEIVMLAAAVGSWFSTPKRIHEANSFNFHPLREVAWLFIGIFATMVTALDYLEVHAAQLGLHSEMAFFWITGLLSGALDNAPTYLTMLAVAMGLHDLNLSNPEHVRLLVGTYDHSLIAISLGSVFFGAMTYIGNGPNFMVKSIADQAQIKTASFFVYLLKYALPILIPIMLLVSFLFFSHWRIF
jgi:Na+/H+ antiporter NhaD/arsenite permease-like protein